MMSAAEQVPAPEPQGLQEAAAAMSAPDAMEHPEPVEADPTSQPFCRICHEPSAPDNPLIRPCKCSGSIQHVHHSCQLEWLRRSRRRQCEMCHAPFRLVYRRSSRPAAAPRSLAAVVLVQAALHLVRVLLFMLCSWLTALTWHLVLVGTQQPRLALSLLRRAATPAASLSYMLQGVVLWAMVKAFKLVILPHIFSFGRHLLSQTYEDLGVWAAWDAAEQAQPGQRPRPQPPQHQQEQEQEAQQPQQQQQQPQHQQGLSSQPVGPGDGVGASAGSSSSSGVGQVSHSVGIAEDHGAQGITHSGITSSSALHSHSSNSSSSGSHSSQEGQQWEDLAGSSDDMEEGSQVSSARSSDDHMSGGAAEASTHAPGRAPAAGTQAPQGEPGPSASSGSDTDGEAAAASTAEDEEQDELLQYQYTMLAQHQRQRQERQQQQAAGRQQAGGGQEAADEQQAEGGQQPAAAGGPLVWVYGLWLFAVFIAFKSDALLVPLCFIMPAVLTGRSVLVLAHWLLGTPVTGVAASITSPTAAASMASPAAPSQQQATQAATPWLPITPPVVLLTWCLGVWGQIYEYISPHLMLPLSLADVTALTLGEAVLSMAPVGAFVLFAILTKYLGLEPGADTHQGFLALAASCWLTSYRSFLKTAEAPFVNIVACIAAGVALDVFIAPLAGVSPYHHLWRLAQAPVVSALTHYLPGLALLVLWLQLRAAEGANLRPGALPILNSSAGQAGQPWYAHLAFHAQVLCLAGLAVGLPVQLVRWCAPQLLPLKLTWYAAAPGTTLDVQLASLAMVAVLRCSTARAHIELLLCTWVLLVSLVLRWPDYLLKDWAARWLPQQIAACLATGISLEGCVHLFTAPIGTLQWHSQRPGFWLKHVVLALTWVVTWALPGSCLLLASIAAGRFAACQLHLPFNNDLLVLFITAFLLVASGRAAVQIFCWRVVGFQLRHRPGARRSSVLEEQLLYGVIWFGVVGSTVGHACRTLLQPVWQQPAVPTWAAMYQDTVLGAAVLMVLHAAAALMARHFPVRPTAQLGPTLHVLGHVPWPMAVVVLHMFGAQYVTWQHIRPLVKAVLQDMWRGVLLPSALRDWLWPLVWLPQGLDGLHAWVEKWGLLVYVGVGVWRRAGQCLRVIAVLMRARGSARRMQAMMSDVSGILEYSEPEAAA